MNDTPAAYALDQARALAVTSRFWLVFLSILALVTASGPFGTFDTLGPLARLAYWSAVCLVCFWLGFFTSMVCATRAEDRGLPPLLSAALGGLIAGVPISLFIGVLDIVFFSRPLDATLRTVTPYTCFISAVISILYELLDLGADGQHPPDQKTSPEWLDKLPADLGRDILWLQAQDHYVLARTMSGTALVRSSLTEAEEALGGRGLRVHRSWWVARTQMTRLLHAGGAAKLLLKNGDEIPVGRVFRKKVRRALSESRV